jgi:hypothetical protein
VPKFVPTGNPHDLRSIAALDPASVESIATYSNSLCPPSKSSNSCVSNVGSPFKAWVAGSNPAALTKISGYLEDFGGVDFGYPRTPRTVSTQLAQRFALLISRGISPPSGRPSCVLSVGRRKPLVRKVPRLSLGWCDEVAIVHTRRSRSGNVASYPLCLGLSFIYPGNTRFSCNTLPISSVSSRRRKFTSVR